MKNIRLPRRKFKWGPSEDLYIRVNSDDSNYEDVQAVMGAILWEIRSWLLDSAQGLFVEETETNNGLSAWTLYNANTAVLSIREEMNCTFTVIYCNLNDRSWIAELDIKLSEHLAWLKSRKKSSRIMCNNRKEVMNYGKKN